MRHYLSSLKWAPNVIADAHVLHGLGELSLLHALPHGAVLKGILVVEPAERGVTKVQIKLKLC